jgi:hypothetical protein
MPVLKILITASRYDELVCTAGVTPDGDFVRLYPINFRDLPYTQQYRKYEWISVQAEKHTGRDVRKESYRPDCDTLRILGTIKAERGDWSERARYALARKARSMEELYERKQLDNTSLGIFKPSTVRDLVISTDAPDWKPSFKANLVQARLWETRAASREPPRKVPFKFHYQFECDDKRCARNHKMMIEDWEVGALYWKLVDKGAEPKEAAREVREKFLHEICGPDKDTHFFVGTVSGHPNSWVIIGVFWPKLQATAPSTSQQLNLF